MSKISIGDKVRSYDFPENRDHYIEGEVVGIERKEGCDRYAIKVDKAVFRGKAFEGKLPEYVYPPVNGTPKLFGGVTSGVEKVGSV